MAARRAGRRLAASDEEVCMATLTAPRRQSGPTTAELAAAIGRVPIFARCTKRELRRVAAIAELREVASGATLIREGEPGREFAVILAGEVEVRRRGRKVRTLVPGDWFGEIALLSGGERTATATATRPTRLLVIRGGMFRTLLEHTPSIAFKVLERVAALVPAAGRDC